MRLYPIAILVGLSACASVPSENEVGTRLASWHGAPATDLVAVLGEPVISERGSWIWQFPGPGDGEVVAYGSAYGGRPLRPMSSYVGGPSVSARMSGEVWPVFGFSGTYRKHVVCKYIGHIENGVITKLTTLSKPGTHCRFDELPLRSD